jgi:hypothetical protein
MSGSYRTSSNSMDRAAEEPLTRWRLYVRRGSFERVPPTFAEVGEAIDAFLRPVAESIAYNEPFDLVWPPGGPWQGGITDA